MILVKPRKPEQIKKNQWAWASIFASAQNLASLATFWVLFTIQIEQLVAAAFPGPSSRELTCFRARNEFNANYHKNDISRAMCAKRIDESCEGRGRNTKGNDVESGIKDIDFKPTDKDREAERVSDEHNQTQSIAHNQTITGSTNEKLESKTRRKPHSLWKALRANKQKLENWALRSLWYNSSRNNQVPPYFCSSLSATGYDEHRKTNKYIMYNKNAQGNGYVGGYWIGWYGYWIGCWFCWCQNERQKAKCESVCKWWWNEPND